MLQHVAGRRIVRRKPGNRAIEVCHRALFRPENIAGV
jgi:hypothetical protein